MFNNDVGSKPLDKFVEVPFKAKGTSNKERIKEIQELSKPVFNLTWEQAKAEYNRMNKGKIFVNDTYQVLVYVGKETDEIYDDQLMDKGMVYLSIKRLDRKPVRSWTDLQQIKNALCEEGKDRWAVELYPPECQLVNVADQYHLYVYPVGFNPPFGKYPRGLPWEDEEESNA